MYGFMKDDTEKAQDALREASSIAQKRSNAGRARAYSAWFPIEQEDGIKLPLFGSDWRRQWTDCGRDGAFNL
ncbi:hypothetical protein MASR2M78_16830 [Treponema sp.]